MNSPALRTWAEIDLGAIRANANFILSKACPGSKLIAVLKANGYGHGAVPVADCLEGVASAFAVATLSEAVELGARDVPILLLSPCLPEERIEVARRGFVPTVSSVEEARAYQGLGIPISIHFKVDTGMGRLGVLLHEAEDALARIRSFDRLALHSVSTHLPSADEDPAFTMSQLEAFEVFRAANDIGASHVHVLNSAGVLAYPWIPMAFVRVGIALYGVSPLAEYQEPLRPALSWKTRVTLVRELPEGWGVSYGRRFLAPGPMKVATLAVGYADGYPRQASGRGAEVLIRGCRRPVLGSVTMDQIVVDVSQAPAVQEGDEVVLLGSQGADRILATELAAKANTITWDILSGLGKRVIRSYLE